MVFRRIRAPGFGQESGPSCSAKSSEKPHAQMTLSMAVLQVCYERSQKIIEPRLHG